MGSTRVLRLESTASTNADATRLAQDGESGPLWVVAREQKSGRGRRGRVWHSPPGNLYASLLLVDPCPADVAPLLGFVAGVGLVDAVDTLLGPPLRAQLKWPNDLLVSGAKIAGMLLEATRRADGALVCVIGIGINCRSHPADAPYPTTDLSQVAGHDIDPDDLLPLLDSGVQGWLARWDRGSGFSRVREAWLARAAGLGKHVDVTMHGREIGGRFDSIDAHGRLVVTTATGPVFVDAGDVRFTIEGRSAMPQAVAS